MNIIIEKTLDRKVFHVINYVYREKMDFIEIGYEYLLGVPEIDNQHKELAKRLNNAIKHCTGKKKDEDKFYYENIDYSIKFLKSHFDLEEKILCKTDYENTEKHKADHKKILDEITKMTEDIEKKKIELNLFYVTAFVKERVMKHIKKHDVAAKKHFIEGNKINEARPSAKTKR
ncbi:MAG: hemerythrin family protein [Treponema sp.]|jgi:hemerythrin|nr:hemerythrin family protein [Treponema sp.]